MRFTAVLRERARIKSLALSVHFRQPEFAMEHHEILSRATAHLLAVDAPPRPMIKDDSYGHLGAAAEQRAAKVYKQKMGMSYAAGAGRNIMDMGYLEFVPKEYRPQVHIVCSSHVVSPFLWKDYYPQPWLSQVRQEHCRYSLEIFDPENPEQALVKLELDSQPYHHPFGRDISLLHFKEEKSALDLLKDHAIEILYIRDPEKLYEKGEEMRFDGYVVSERNATDVNTYTAATSVRDSSTDEDTRVFFPYQETGQLAFHTEDRFFATTPHPLPEGMCGGPVLDTDGRLCGCVEGIVPVHHANPKLAGSAAFMPSHVMKAFVDSVERALLRSMMDAELFQMVETAKMTNSIGGGFFKKDEKGTYTAETTIEEEYDKVVDRLKHQYSPEQYEAIMSVVEQERDEVIKLFDKEGGDLNTIVTRTIEKREEIRRKVEEEYQKAMEQQKQQEAGTTITSPNAVDVGKKLS